MQLGVSVYDLRVSTLRLQAGSATTGFAWDSEAYAFVESNTDNTQLAALLALAQLCRIASAAPVVQCLPTAASTRSQKVQLQLQLTVPSRSRLLGWQPTGSAVSAEAEALSLTTDTPQMDVAVLVRPFDGPHMPVSLKLLSDSRETNVGETATVCVEVSGNYTACGVCVEVRRSNMLPCRKSRHVLAELQLPAVW